MLSISKSWAELICHLDNTSNKLDEDVISCLLRLCSKVKALLVGKFVHHFLLESSVADAHLTSLLVHMYGQCGSIDDALVLFESFYSRNVLLSNAMIRAFSQQGEIHKSFHLYDQMHNEGILPDKMTFVHVVSASSNEASLMDCQRLHNRIISNEFEADLYIGTSLIKMYGNCGSLQNALQTFEHMSDRNEVTWTAIIAVCNEHRQARKSFQLYTRMQQEAVLPDGGVFVNTLVACASEMCLRVGKELHACLEGTGFEMNVVIATAVLDMYGSCGRIEDAQAVFDRIPRQNVVSWSAIIVLYAENGDGWMALQLYEEMWEHGILPNRVTLLGVIAACASQTAVDEGRQVHFYILDSELQHEVALRNALIGMYGVFGSLPDAESVFNSIADKSVVSWNALIAVYNEHGEAKLALGLFEQMLERAFLPGKTTFVSVLSACALLVDPVCGMCMHGCIVEDGVETDTVIGTSLIIMYGNFGSVEDAERTFIAISDRDTVSWNALITVFSEHGYVKRAVEFFGAMQPSGVMPDKATFTSLLLACSSAALFSEGKKMNAYILDMKLERDPGLQNALLDLYGKCGSLDHARQIFGTMVDSSVTSFTTMVSLHALYGDAQESFQLFHRMQEEGFIPAKSTYVGLLAVSADDVSVNVVKQIHLTIIAAGFAVEIEIKNALINIYGKLGLLEQACRVFDTMSKKNVDTWNCMVGVYAQHGQMMRILQLLDDMYQHGVNIDCSSCFRVLTACSHAGCVYESFHLLKFFDVAVMDDHLNCMVDILGRAGLLKEAKILAHGMPFQPKALTFMAVLAACRPLADFATAECAALYAIELDACDPAPFVALSQVYGVVDRRQLVDLVMEEACLTHEVVYRDVRS